MAPACDAFPIAYRRELMPQDNSSLYGNFVVVYAKGSSHSMHVISRKTLLEFWLRYPDSEAALQAWFHEAGAASWRNSAELKAKYGGASIVNSERVVFNICGNKYRLIVRINYVSGALFVRFIGTHREYDQVDAESI